MKNENNNNKQSHTPNPILKFLIDLGPLVIFFIFNSRFDIIKATAAFMVAIIISFILSFWLEKKIPILPLFTAILVIIFGGLTIILNDATFIKIKPTIINVLFALILYLGLFFDKLFLKMLFNSAWKITDYGWRMLTYRWAGFFIFLALANELVWRTMSTDAWVNFKVFAIMPITLVFALFQLRLINKNKLKE